MKSFNALLLAAGRGERLRPLTDTWPKCLMPIHGRPLLEYWISDLLNTNVDKIYVNTHYLSHIVHEFLERDCFADRITVLTEASLLGTAGTIVDSYEAFQSKPTLVVHADNWCGMPLVDFLDQHSTARPIGCEITMMTFETDKPQSCGIVDLNEENLVINFHEKVKHPPSNRANAAVYIIEPDVVSWMKNQNVTDFSKDVVPKFLNKIFAINNDFFHRDIGTLNSLLAAQNDPPKDLHATIKNQDDWIKKFLRHSVHQQVALATS